MSEQPALPAKAGTAEHGTLLSLRDAAARLSVSVATLRRWLRAGELDGAVQQRGAHGPEWFVPLATVESRLAGSRVAKPATSSSASELAAAVELVHRLELELATVRALAAERAQQLDQLHATMRTLMLTAGSEPASEPQRKRWWRKG